MKLFGYTIIGAFISSPIEKWDSATRKKAIERMKTLAEKAEETDNKTLRDGLFGQAQTLKNKIDTYDRYIETNRGEDAF